VAQGCFGLPPTERAVPARADHCDVGMSVGRAFGEYPDHGRSRRTGAISSPMGGYAVTLAGGSGGAQIAD